MRRLVVFASALMLSRAAFAQEVPTSSTATTAPAFTPPVALTETAIAHPEGAPLLTEPIEVTVKIRIDERGEVERVELVRGAGQPFDAAVLEGATRFRFEPGRYGGKPVPVDIQFTQRFVPPPVTAEAMASEPEAFGILDGRIEERGRRTPVPFATLEVTTSTGAKRSVDTDEEGRFEVRLAPGTVKTEVLATGYDRFVQTETIEDGQRRSVIYLITAQKKNPYEVVVHGERRVEVSSTKLKGREIKQIPGTFGDPFRVVSALPGVSPMTTLLPFPVVRGSSPGNTGFLIDGVRVPLLFHLLAGPSVIHPELIDSIEFSPGGFPVEYGGYTGGIVDGKTRAMEPATRTVDTDLNLLQVGGLVREPTAPIGRSLTIAGRYGYPGLFLSLANPRVDLSYWDYQARFDIGDERSGFTVFALGSRDALDSVPAGEPDDADKEPLLHFEFHRVDLRYKNRSDAVDALYQVTLGADYTLSRNDATIESLYAQPKARFTIPLDEELDLRLGVDGLVKSADLIPGAETAGRLGDLLGGGALSTGGTLYTGGLLSELLFRPYPEVVLRPGIRTDLYTDTSAEHVGVDPRFLARVRVVDEAPELWVKGGVGLYHQPPRFTVPVPGLDQVAFEQGLLEATQITAGAEVELINGFSVDVQTYFNWMDPIIYDVAINPSVEDVGADPPSAPPGEEPVEPPVDRDGLDDRLDELLVPATGRSYGLEVLLRKQSSDGVAGWIAYTLSRSERRRDGEWVAFDFDRTHILNFVLSIPLPRRWQVGLRAQALTGRPLTTTFGLASARTSTFVRFDLRIDKTAVWNDWLLDFYVDISNAVLAAEELAPQNQVRYVLPTVGFRAIF